MNEATTASTAKARPVTTAELRRTGTGVVWLVMAKARKTSEPIEPIDRRTRAGERRRNRSAKVNGISASSTSSSKSASSSPASDAPASPWGAGDTAVATDSAPADVGEDGIVRGGGAARGGSDGGVGGATRGGVGGATR